MTLKLTWSATDNVGISTYKVYFDDVLKANQKTTSYTLSNVGEGDHTYRIEAFDAAGNMVSTGNTSVRFDDMVAPVIDNVSIAQQQGTYKFIITPNASDNITSTSNLTYKVQYALTQSGVASATAVSGLQFTLDAANAGKPVYYRINVADEAGNSVWSDIKSINVADVTNPGNVSGLKETINGTSVTLDWADSSDVLYSPRVTTISGTTAKIDMSEKHYYPEEWETIDSETTNGWRIEATPQPSLDDEQLTGIVFEVTPTADRKTGLISVPIDIPVRQFAGWLKVDTRSGADNEDGEFVQKPILSERTIKTSVTVKDGETVLIGGMTIDNSESIDDKVPILGDLPFIGRFFQSKYVKSQKNNLLVFMTCRMVRPDGSAINPKGQANGLMEFPRNY